ncbi:NAD-dependent epimerase/dehydratase family protein [Candidatus Pelagibacter sp.]|nr:NAD-dependent epimerase/dehydratase family protein [Candidatus Pelagibacter sp.]
MKNYIIITGGAGFVGSNLIELLLKKTKKKIISIDNYSSGFIRNHINNSRVKYLKAETVNLDKVLSRYKNQIDSLFHFAEFSRIYQSFKNFNKCFESNSKGTQIVFKFCLDNRIKLIYSATSASLGNKGQDKNLSPYAFTKSKNLELLENLRKWFNFKFEVVYFYNVYGPRQIRTGEMATVIGIFEDQYKNNKPLTVVKPGTQTRRFTHINDTINVCYEAWIKNRCTHYSISNKKFYSIKEVAEMFNRKIRLLKARPGERFASALTNISQNSKIIKKYGKLHLKDYITSVIKG